MAGEMRIKRPWPGSFCPLNPGFRSDIASEYDDRQFWVCLDKLLNIRMKISIQRDRCVHPMTLVRSLVMPFR